MLTVRDLVERRWNRDELTTRLGDFSSDFWFRKSPNGYSAFDLHDTKKKRAFLFKVGTLLILATTIFSQHFLEN